jgi:hypothetical protein
VQLRWWAPVLAALRERFGALDVSLDAAAAQHWLSVVQNNAITLTTVDSASNYDIRSVAAGLYLHASFFNQCVLCSPPRPLFLRCKLLGGLRALSPLVECVRTSNT